MTDANMGGQARVDILGNPSPMDRCPNDITIANCKGTHTALAMLELAQLADNLSPGEMRYSPMPEESVPSELAAHTVETGTAVKKGTVNCHSCGMLVCAQAIVIDRGTANITTGGVRVAYTRSGRDSNPAQVVAVNVRTGEQATHTRPTSGWFKG